METARNKICHKVFLSSSKEEKWLNKLGKNGWMLTSRSCMTYEFCNTNKNPTYRIEYFHDSVKSPETAKYLETASAEGRKLCAAYGNYAYFIQDEEISSEALERQIKRCKKLSLFYAAVFAYFDFLLVYNVISAVNFNNMDYTVPQSTEIYKIFKFVVGTNPAFLFSFVVVLFWAVSTWLLFIYYREWGVWTKRQKAAVAAAAAEVTEEQ